jgi:protoporphyrinogen oxidase
LVLGRRVQSVKASSQCLEVTYGDGESTGFDRVVVTTPAPVARRICKGLSNEESSRLADVSYQGLVCASLVLTRPLGGYYLTYITDPGFPFTAVVEMTALVDPSHFDQKTLVYLPRYADPSDGFFGMTDREVIDRFVNALCRMYPDLRQEQIIAARVSRVPSVFAIPTTGYSDRLPDMVTSVRGLYIVQSAHIVNGTLNVNETVKLAHDALNELIGTDGMPSVPRGGARPSNV